MKKVALIFGTRPEAIKLAPVFREIMEGGRIDARIIVTAQHREMLDQVLSVFHITPDYDLNIMAPEQTLFEVTAKAISGLGAVLQSLKPDIVLVQGDTTTTFIGSLAAYYLKIPVGHVEAGLRTGNIYSPFPEEINRRLTGAISAQHFAPTKGARENLLSENVPPGRIHVTGNTAIDALLWTINNTTSKLAQVGANLSDKENNRKLILITAHRRESFGLPMQRVMEALQKIAKSFPDVSLVFPVHYNPNVRRQTDKYLKGIDNIVLTDPLDYVDFCHLMSKVYLIVTDSGGIQEEAPSLGKPVLVLRDTTERPEGVEAGVAKLVGTDVNLIFSETASLLTDQKYYQSMAQAVNPYGDGQAAKRIADIVYNYLSNGGI